MSANLKSSHKGWYQLPALLAVGFVLTILIACNETSQTASTAANVSMTPTQSSATSSPYMDTDATQQAADDQLATYEVAQRTSVAPTTIIFDITKTAIALTPINLRLTFTPYPTAPIPTPLTGIVNGGGAIPGPYAILNYWLGTVDGQVGAVASGSWRYGWQRNQDQNEGLIFVYKGQFLLVPTSPEVYRVPIEVGAMLITSVSGTQVTLSESVYDAASNSIIPLPGGAIVVFDIATRQFLSAQCGQSSSSCTPVPIGTTTPVSTPLPTEVVTPPMMQTATAAP